MKTVKLLLVLLFLAPASVALSQTGQIAGTVTDEDTGEPIPGVNVTIEGTQQGAATDSEGTYTIGGVEPGTYAVQASFIGYAEATAQGVEVQAGQTTTVNFAMAQQVAGLDEVVVVGYGETRRQDLTGSVSSVSTEQIESIPTSSVQEALQGQTAGVQITQNSGAPDASFTVRIRGANSMLGGNDPLYVVDGFPISGSPDYLDPGDVASIEVLKDASAAAIYGARGANGVVMITTKEGQRDTRIQFKSWVGAQQIIKKLDLLNSRQYAEIANELAELEGEEIPFQDLNSLQHNTDWQDEVYRTGLQQNHSISANWRNEQTQYRLSGSYTNNEGIIHSTSLERGQLRFNLDSDITNRLSISNRATLVRSEDHEVPTSGTAANVVQNIYRAPPVIPVRDEQGNYYDYTDFFWIGWALPRNPVADIEEITDVGTSWRVQDNLSAEYQLTEAFSVQSRVGVDYQSFEDDFYATSRHEEGGNGGSGSESRAEQVLWLNENTLNYTSAFGDNHRVDVTVGNTWQHQQNSGLSASASGFVTDLLENNALGSGTSISPPDVDGSSWTLLSGFGRINYILMDRYLLTMTGRADGSSRFGTGNKWGYFPSAALAWRASEEPFLQDVEALSNLKLRLSWGLTGNQEIGLFNSLQQIRPDLLTIGDGSVTGFAPANIANPELKWESTEQYNIGVDVGFYDERLRFAADAYVKNTEDLLARVNLPSSTGFGTILRNVGSIENRGFELGVGGTPIQREGLEWSLDGHITVSRNEVKELAQGNEFLGSGISLHGNIHLIREGEPLPVFYGFVEEELLDENGRIQYVDQNDDGLINDEDRKILGNPHPDFTFGLNSSLSYRNFDLSFFLQGSYGNDMYNINRGFAASSFTRGLNQIQEVYEERWSPDNPDRSAKHPRLSTALQRPSARFIEDASYVRLKNLRLSYSVPVTTLGLDQRVRDLMIFVSGQNLVTLTGYSWYDPEVSEFGGSTLNAGVDRATYPQTRTYTFGLQLGL